VAAFIISSSLACNPPAFVIFSYACNAPADDKTLKTKMNECQQLCKKNQKERVSRNSPNLVPPRKNCRAWSMRSAESSDEVDDFFFARE
jgi:hypothetical protein